MNKEEFLKIVEICQNPNLDKAELKKYAIQVAESGNPYAICDFCEYVDATDNKEIMPILQSAIQDCGDFVHIYEFAFLMADCGRKNVDYLALQNQIIFSENSKLICYSSEYVPTFDQKALADGMIAFGNEKWLEHYIEAKGYHAGLENASEAEKLAQENALKQRLAAEKERDYYTPKRFKKMFPECHSRAEYAQELISSKNPYAINEFAENEATLYTSSPEIWKELVVPYLDAVIATGEMLHIYEFGASVPGADIRKIEKAAIESEMPKYMYYVAAYVEGADMNLMLKEIDKAKSEKYSAKLREHMAEVGVEIEKEGENADRSRGGKGLADK